MLIDTHESHSRDVRHLLGTSGPRDVIAIWRPQNVPCTCQWPKVEPCARVRSSCCGMDKGADVSQYMVCRSSSVAAAVVWANSDCIAAARHAVVAAAARPFQPRILDQARNSPGEDNRATDIVCAMHKSGALAAAVVGTDGDRIAVARDRSCCRWSVVGSRCSPRPLQ